jgi:hypothetical protein
MTPPNVLGAPKPTSSVMISNMFGAPFGGTTRAGHAGLDCKALSPISTSNLWGEQADTCRLWWSRHPVNPGCQSSAEHLT